MPRRKQLFLQLTRALKKHVMDSQQFSCHHSMKVVTRTMEINQRVSLRLEERKRRSSTPLETYPCCRWYYPNCDLRDGYTFKKMSKETTPTKNSLDELKKTTSSCAAKKRSSKEIKSDSLAENSSKDINSCTTNEKDTFKEATPTCLVENSSFKATTSTSSIESISLNKTTPTTLSKQSSCKETVSNSFKSCRPKRKKSWNHEFSPINKKLRLFPPTMEKMLDQNEIFRESEDKCKSGLSNERKVKRSRQVSAKKSGKVSVVY